MTVPGVLTATFCPPGTITVSPAPAFELDVLYWAMAVTTAAITTAAAPMTATKILRRASWFLRAMRSAKPIMSTVCTKQSPSIRLGRSRLTVKRMSTLPVVVAGDVLVKALRHRRPEDHLYLVSVAASTRSRRCCHGSGPTVGPALVKSRIWLPLAVVFGQRGKPAGCGSPCCANATQ